MTPSIMKQAKPKFKWLLSWQALIIAALSAIGYGVAYVHELGFNNDFGIPQELIVLNLTTVLVAIGKVLAIAAVALFVFGLGYIVYFVLLRTKSDGWRLIVRLAIPLFLFLVFIIALWKTYPSLWPELILLIPMLLFFDLRYIHIPIIFAKRCQRLYSKVESPSRV